VLLFYDHRMAGGVRVGRVLDEEIPARFIGHDGWNCQAGFSLLVARWRRSLTSLHALTSPTCG
jgi:hypothetical protein